MKESGSIVSSAVDVAGYAMICPQGVQKMISLPHPAGQKSYPAYACPDSVYAGVVPPGKLRRLGHVQKMAIAASHGALGNSSVQHQCYKDIAVTLGTGLGVLGETSQFLENMVINDEKQPKPTCFVNSVHNSIASQIAMTFGFKAEAHTFTHDSISFELALWQAAAILRLGRADYVLACGADELSPYVIAFGDRYRWWQTEAVPLLPMSLNGAARHGTIAGEGAAAFVLCRAEGSLETPRAGRILSMDVRPRPDGNLKNLDVTEEVGFISGAIAQADYTLADADFFLFGANGDAFLDSCYAAIAEALSDTRKRNIRYGVYKHLCGEYCTASAVGLGEALAILREGVPPSVERSKSQGVSRPVSNVVLYNLSNAGYHSISLVSL